MFQLVPIGVMFKNKALLLKYQPLHNCHYILDKGRGDARQGEELWDFIQLEESHAISETEEGK